MPRSTSPVDQHLAKQASDEGYPTNARQIERWRSNGLLPPNERLFPGRGSTAAAAEGAAKLVSWLARNARRGRRPSDLALLAFAEGLPVPEATVREAFAAAVRRIGLQIENDMPEGSPPEDIADAAVIAGLTGTVLPERLRRIDHSIRSLILDWAPPGSSELDPGPTGDPSTSRDWVYNSVLALLKGGGELTVEQMGQMARSVLPRATVAPFAADLEQQWPNNEAEREVLLNESGGFSFIPEGDIRQRFEDYASDLPLEELFSGWHASVELANWADQHCADVEAEMASNSLGPSTLDWLVGASIGPTRVLMTIGLRGAGSSPSDTVFTAFLLIFMRDLLRNVRKLMPTGSFENLSLPGVLPPCVLTMLGDLTDPS